MERTGWTLEQIGAAPADLIDEMLVRYASEGKVQNERARMDALRTRVNGR